MIDRKYQLLQYLSSIWLLVAVLGVNTASFSQNSSSLFGLIEANADASVSIVFDLDSLQRHKESETDFPALFSFASVEKNHGVITCTVSARGNYRKTNCAFPPIKINFVKGDLKDLGLEKFDEYKVVTPCLENKDAEALLYKELLVYRLFNELTNNSFRVTSFPLTYIDIDSDWKISSKAFLIESDEELEDRIGGKWCKCENAPPEAFDLFQHEVYALFQYMVGNRDMDLSKGHNVKILERKSDRKLIPIPYDFDFSPAWQ